MCIPIAVSSLQTADGGLTESGLSVTAAPEQRYIGVHTYFHSTYEDIVQIYHNSFLTLNL